MKIFHRKRDANIKVNFVVAGSQKGGTTALDAYLRKHKSICMASKKEVHFFDKEKNYKKGSNFYHSFFEIKSSETILGDATPIYMYWYDAPKRIWQYNPDMKFICILRNPIERAYSHWNMQRGRGIDTLSFWDAIHKEKERCRKKLPFQHRKFSYVDRGYYTEQLRRIWHFFPKKQTLVIKNEDLRRSLNDTLCQIARFLEVEDFKNIQSDNIHSRQYVSQMTQKERNYLKKLFFLQIKELENLLDWDCSDWLA